MFIPKGKMHILTDAIAVAINNENWTDEEIELLHQVSDRASLCQDGDAPWLEVEVCYANKPE